MTGRAESALVALVPELDPVLDAHRRRLDTGAIRGVPAHVTVLYPWIPPANITNDVLTALGSVLREHPAFDLTFDAIRWFGDEVAYVRPNPDNAFRQLTAAIWQHWPDHPPYEGRIADPIPHLTIGDTGRSPELEAAAAEIEGSLPVRCRIERLHLMAGTDEMGSWTVRTAIPLG